MQNDSTSVAVAMNQLNGGHLRLEKASEEKLITPNNDVKAVLVILKQEMRDLLWHVPSYGEFVTTMFHEIAKIKKDYSEGEMPKGIGETK